MIKVVKERVDEEVEYYSDLSGKKIKLEKECFSPSKVVLRVPTQGYEDHSWVENERDWQLVKDVETIDLHLTGDEAISILKFLRKKYPKNKNLKTYYWIK